MSIAPIIGALSGAAIGVLFMGRRSTRQLRKPSNRAGRAVLARMNVSHAGVTAWGLEHVDIRDDFTILDVGCGGGRTVDRLAAIVTGGKVAGVDYSEESVATSRETNQRWIAQGRVDIQQGSVSQLPYADETFDLVTAVETHYYWPDLEQDLREIRRVLKPTGRVVLIAEAYRGRRADWLYRPNVARLPDWVVRLDRTVDVDGFGLERTNVEGQHKPFKLAGLWARFQ